jgi:putative nucleotidyltransferase with HDIG domain
MGRRPNVVSTTAMSSEHTILLISDRLNLSRDLAQQLAHFCACRTIRLGEQDNSASPVTAFVTDIRFSSPPAVQQVRRLLAQLRASATPIVAILRDDSHLERVQAAAIGATCLLHPSASASDVFAAIAPKTRATKLPTSPNDLTPAQNLEQSRIHFSNLFGAAARGEPLSHTEVETSTASVMVAIAEGGIRQWLEIVWAYDDATYQHCMLVTGLAAAFAKNLHFAPNDQKHIIRGALLHDIGKAKIPRGILNKPGALSPDELNIMRAHPGIGYEILHEQGGHDPEILEVVLRHHELLDGSGYPDGLAGVQIKDPVRLVTICDIYAALVERRPYRDPMAPARAFQILAEMDGKLEGALVKAFAVVAEKSAAASRTPGSTANVA